MKVLWTEHKDELGRSGQLTVHRTLLKEQALRLGTLLDASLTLDVQVTAAAKAVFFQHRWISSCSLF